MPSMHKTIIIGNLGSDPGTFEGGKKCTYFSVAVTEKWGTGEAKGEHTEWYRIKTFGTLAEMCAKYLTKGSLVYVEGKLRTESYEKDGNIGASVNLIANTVQFLSLKRKTEEVPVKKKTSVVDKQYDVQTNADFTKDDIPFMRITNEEMF